jgi:hypothetical protein
MHASDIRPVFFDPKGRRSRRVVILLSLVGAVLALATATYLIGLVVAPIVVGIRPAPSRPAITIDPPPIANPQGVLHRFAAVNRALLPASRDTAKRIAFQRGSASGGASLRRNAENLDTAFVELLELDERAGSVSIEIQQNARREASWLKRYANHIETYALIDTPLRPARVAAALASSRNRHVLVEQISKALRALGAKGVVLDLRDSPETGHAFYVMFLRELEAELKRNDRAVAIIAPLDLPAHRYREMARYSRYVVLPLFSEYPAGKGPTPIAAQHWFESELITHAAHIPREKLVVGIGSFATDWNAAMGAKQISVQAAWDIARPSGDAETRSDKPQYRI